MNYEAIGCFVVGLTFGAYVVSLAVEYGKKSYKPKKTHELTWERGKLLLKCLVCGSTSYHKTDFDPHCENCEAFRHTFGGS